MRQLFSGDVLFIAVYLGIGILLNLYLFLKYKFFFKIHIISILLWPFILVTAIKTKINMKVALKKKIWIDKIKDQDAVDITFHADDLDTFISWAQDYGYLISLVTYEPKTSNQYTYAVAKSVDLLNYMNQNDRKRQLCSE